MGSPRWVPLPLPRDLKKKMSETKEKKNLEKFKKIDPEVISLDAGAVTQRQLEYTSELFAST